MKRRALIVGGSSLGLGTALASCESGRAPPEVVTRPSSARDAELPQTEPPPPGAAPRSASPTSASFELHPLPPAPTPWKTFDPFLFCVHHDDEYPSGDQRMGPSTSLAGRQLGSDFARKDGWSMYHGRVVPGFPRHPHRGFETITVTRRGFVDHSDSLGATARYGEGDVQWMTAGRGIAHAEMFPLIRREQPNPMELFQIWLNLPRRSKGVPAHFSMLWGQTLPRVSSVDERGRATRVTVIAGELDGRHAPDPPPHSWASQAHASVSIWSMHLQAGAQFLLPEGAPGIERTLYFFRGDSLMAAGEKLSTPAALRLHGTQPLPLEAGTSDVELLLLAGRPIGEPVVQRGPFVMNEPSEIRQAALDYRQNQFGGWPWADSDPVHPADSGRFAVHADGRRERG